MPIDPMIPLMAKPLNVMSPYQLQEGAQQIQGMQQKNALMGMEIQKEQQAIQKQNALLQIFQQPGMRDEKTGRPTVAAVNAVSRIDADLANKMGNALIESAHKEAQTAELGAHADERKLDTALKQLEMGHELNSNTYSEYLKSKDQGASEEIAVAAMNSKSKELYDNAKKDGSGNHFQPWAPQTPQQVLWNMQTAKGLAKAIEDRQKEAATNAIIMQSPDGNLYRVPKSGEGSIQAYIPEEKKFVGGTFRLPVGSHPISQPSIEMVAGKAAAVERAKLDVGDERPGGAGSKTVIDPDTGTEYVQNRSGKAFKFDENGNPISINPNDIPKKAVTRGSAAATRMIDPVTAADQKQLIAGGNRFQIEHYRTSNDTAQNVAQKLNDPREGYRQVTPEEARALVDQAKMMMQNYRARTGGKYEEEQFNAMNSVIDKASKFITSIGKGHMILSSPELLNLTSLVSNMYSDRNSQLLRYELGVAQNTEEKGGKAHLLNLQGSVADAVRYGKAKKINQDGKDWLVFKPAGNAPVTPDDMFPLPKKPKAEEE